MRNLKIILRREGNSRRLQWKQKYSKSKCNRKQNLSSCHYCSEGSPFLIIITKFTLVFILQEGVSLPTRYFFFFLTEDSKG